MYSFPVEEAARGKVAERYARVDKVANTLGYGYYIHYIVSINPSVSTIFQVESRNRMKDVL
jgi:hypothetical protein